MNSYSIAKIQINSSNFVVSCLFRPSKVPIYFNEGVIVLNTADNGRKNILKWGGKITKYKGAIFMNVESGNALKLGYSLVSMFYGFQKIKHFIAHAL